MHLSLRSGAQRWMTAASLAGTLGIVVAVSMPSALAARGTSTRVSVRSGGTLNYRETGTPTCVDPLIAPTTVEGAIDYATFDNLVLMDGKGNFRPDLATHWKYGDKGKRITFFLRHGVRFSNGDPLTASTIKFNMQRILGPVGQQAGMSSFLGPLVKTVVDNKFKVTLVFRTPFRPIMASLANDSLGIIDPKAYKQEGKTKFCEYPVGSGPYKISNFAPGGTSVTEVRNPYRNWEVPWAFNHGKPYMSKIVFKPILSDSTAVSELLSGGVNMSSVAGSQLSRAQHNSGIQLHKVTTTVVDQLIFNTKHAPFNNVAVRRAIGEAVNRQAIIKAALNGLGTATYSPVPPTLPYADHNAKKLAPPYNPSAAKAVLSAHHVSGTYTLISGNTPAATTADELIQAELANVGVNIKIVAKPTPDYISAGQKGQFDIALDGFYGADADVLYLEFDSSQEASGGLNFTGYKNRTLDNLIVQGRSTFNQVKAAQAYNKVQTFLLKNGLCIPLYAPVTDFGTRSNVQGFHTDATGLFPLFPDLHIK